MVAGRSLVLRYYAYRATRSVGFVTPVFTLFLLRDLTFTQVGALSALYSLLSVVGEIPTGFVGDRFGRRTSMLLSLAFAMASLAGFVLARSFAWYAVLYALWALALTLRSGSADAWLYDALDDYLDTGAFSRVRGRGDATERLGGALTMVGGGLLYGIDPTYPFVAAAAVNGLGLLVLLTLPRNRRQDGDGDPRSERLAPRDAWWLIRTHLAQPPLRSLVLYVGLFWAAVGVANGYVQPMAIETLAPYAAALGVDVPAGGAIEAARSGRAAPALALALGVMYAVLSALASIGGYHAGTLEERLGVRGALLVVPAATALAMVLPLGVAFLALPAFACMRASTPLIEPISQGYLNDRVPSAGRATILSAVSMLYMTVRTPLAVAAGIVADASTATTAVAALGVLVISGCGAVWLGGKVAPGELPAAGRD